MLYGFLAKTGLVGYTLGLVILVALGDVASVLTTFLNTLPLTLGALGGLIAIASKAYAMLKNIERKLDANTAITEQGIETVVQKTEENKDAITKTGQKVTNVRKAQASGILTASDKQVDMAVNAKKLEAERDSARLEADQNAVELKRVKEESEARSVDYLARIVELERLNIATKILAESVVISVEPTLRVEPQD